jgi:proteasome lid subunit RPN8/RPN11
MARRSLATRFLTSASLGKAEPFRTSDGTAIYPYYLLPVMILLQSAHAREIISHARESAPRECCGLIGAKTDGHAASIYRMRNVAADPMITYEAAPEDLFAAQRLMRERGEQLLAIYHSHPRADTPTPSATDVRLAYYPSAVYFIVGLGGEEPNMRAFRISESEGRWEPVEYEVVADADH